MKNRTNGFTLIELIVIWIIVGIVASVAIPMIKVYIDKAKQTEAMVALSAIRVAEQAYYVEHNTYRGFDEDPSAIGILPSELDGTYFSHHCYAVFGETKEAATIMCVPRKSRNPPSPRAEEVWDEPIGPWYRVLFAMRISSGEMLDPSSLIYDPN